MENLKFATKVFPNVERAHAAENLGRELRQALASLNVPKLDIFYLHAPDRTTSFEETTKAMDDLYREGLFERVRILIGRNNIVMQRRLENGCLYELLKNEIVWIVEFRILGGCSDPRDLQEQWLRPPNCLPGHGELLLSLAS
jgi:hypothetical protein